MSKRKIFVIGIAGGLAAVFIVYPIIISVITSTSSVMEQVSFQNEKQRICGDGDSITDQYGRHCCTSGFTLSQGCTSDFINP